MYSAEIPGAAGILMQMDLADETFRNFGLLGFSIFWFMTVTMVASLKADKTKSISSHAASARKAALVFGILGIVSAVLLILFFVKWFTPTFNLGLIFNIAVIGILVLFGIAGVVPNTEGIKHKVHVYAAVAASVLLLPAMVLIIASTQVSDLSRVFTTSALFTMLIIGFRLVKRNRTDEKLLAYEALYFLCFDVSVLVVTYVR